MQSFILSLPPAFRYAINIVIHSENWGARFSFFLGFFFTFFPFTYKYISFKTCQNVLIWLMKSDTNKTVIWWDNLFLSWLKKCITDTIKKPPHFAACQDLSLKWIQSFWHRIVNFHKLLLSECRVIQVTECILMRKHKGSIYFYLCVCIASSLLPLQLLLPSQLI